MTEPIDDRRLREAFTLTGRLDAPTPDCLPAETIWGAVQGTLGPTELRRVLVHIAACSLCTESWRLAREIEGDAAEEELPDKAAGAPGRSAGGWVAWTSAAAAALAFVAFGLTYHDPFQGATIARQAAGEERPLDLVASRDPLSTAGCHPRWTALDGATYDVQILNERFELLTEARGLTEPRLLVAPELLRELPSPTNLRIYIVAKRGLEGVVAERTLDLQCPAP